MAMPPEFNYINEDDFIQKLLIPLLNRMGYSVVYHGTREFGRDLIFAEIDRFGHVRYHGLQAKYEPSIGLAAVQTLIDDCRQAFVNPFRHPQTGAEERISTFYAVNGGNISEEASTHFFRSLIHQYGANAKMLNGKALIALDRTAGFSRTESAREILSGLLYEIQYNRRKMAISLETFRAFAEKRERTLPARCLRNTAINGYLIRPAAWLDVSLDLLATYSGFVDSVHETLPYCTSTLTGIEKQADVIQKLVVQHSRTFQLMGEQIEASISHVLNDLKISFNI